MKVFLFKHRLSTRYSTGLFPGFTFLCVLFFLSSCASSGRYPSITAGEPKNSFPFFDRDVAEELHSIAVPAFLGDRHNWHELAVEILSSSKKITVTPSDKINAALKDSKRDLSSLLPEERPAFIAGLGRAMQTDAVMNGVILDKEGHYEISLQVISSKDSRIIWWQAVDVSFREGAYSRLEQQKVLSFLLTPFLSLAGQKEQQPQPQLKQEPVPPSALSPKTEEPSGTETPPAKEPERKVDKKPLKNQKPLQVPGDISPM
jgi:hypothetical protein